jgi:F0F1-type ATP synthase assembly protein I
MYPSSASLQWIALFTTVVVESSGLIVWALVTRRSALAAGAAALLVNVIIHTLFWRLQPAFAPGGLAALYAAEAVVVLVEAVAYIHLLQLTWGRALLCSLVLNFLSYHAGILVWAWVLA